MESMWNLNTHESPFTPVNAHSTGSDTMTNGCLCLAGLFQNVYNTWTKEMSGLDEVI